MDGRLVGMINEWERERRLREAAHERLLNEIGRSERRPRAWRRRLGLVLIGLGSRLESIDGGASGRWTASRHLAPEA